MYKCSICSQEYQSKPDYCDCGNDSFIYIEDNTGTRNEKFPMKQLFSIFIFVLCILLSFAIIQIKSPAKTDKKTAVHKITQKNIPDIEKIWDSTPPKETIQQPDVITVYEKPIKKLNTAPQKTQPKVQPPKKPKTKQSKTIKKPQKPAAKETKPVTKPKPAAKTQPQKVSPETKTKTQQVQTQPPVIQPKPQPPVTPAPKPVKTMDSRQWDNFKNSLRYTLLSRLDLVKIVGEGECAVEFSFDKTGKLLNRKFIYKSPNKSLNDQIYIMLMKVPVYKAPPANYNGEKVKIKFYINNGYYEISFI